MPRIALALPLGVATLMAAPVKRGQPLADTPIYTPDLVSAYLAAPFEEGQAATAAALPERFPYWADLVNKELVSQDGSGVYVAVLDTGLVSSWPTLFSQANIAAHLGKGFTHDVTWDDELGDIVVGPLRGDKGFVTGYASGHGTHVTSTIVGFQRQTTPIENSYWVTGIAPKATIIPVSVLDAWVVNTPEGLVGLSGGTNEMIAAGIDYIADLAPTLDGPVVINMSLGGPSRSSLIESAVNRAISRGVIIVASAGNSGSEGMGYPGALPQVISAAAGGWATMFASGWTGDVPEELKTKDAAGNTWQIYLEDFSSRPNHRLGQKNQDLDVTAPGAWIVGPYKNTFSSSIGYYYLSGTSMAAPHVSAISALVLQARPRLSQTKLEAVLRAAASGLPLPASDATVVYPFEAPYEYPASWNGGDWGAGFLRADAAISAAAKAK